MSEVVTQLAGRAFVGAARAGAKKLFGRKKKVHALGKPKKGRKKIPTLTALLLLSAVFPILSDRPFLRIRRPFRGDLFTTLLLLSWLRRSVRGTAKVL